MKMAGVAYIARMPNCVSCPMSVTDMRVSQIGMGARLCVAVSDRDLGGILVAQRFLCLHNQDALTIYVLRIASRRTSTSVLSSLATSASA